MMNFQSFPSGSTILINSLNQSSQNNEKSVYLPGAVRRSFLQNPSWAFRLNKVKSQPEKNKKDEKTPESSDATTTLIAKPLPNLTLQIHLPAFYSLATVLRCGHTSQLVGKWLCNPMEQLKKQSKKAYLLSASQKNDSTLSIMPDATSSFQNEEDEGIDLDLTERTGLEENSLALYKKNNSGLTSLSLYLQDYNGNPQALELVFIDSLILETSTIISISYQCGSFSISIQSISNLEFVALTAYPVPVLVNCQFNNQSTSIAFAVAQPGNSSFSEFAPFQTTPHYFIEDNHTTLPEFTTDKNITANLSDFTEKERLGYDVLQTGVVEFANTYLPVWTTHEGFDEKSNPFIDFEQEDILEYQEDDSSEDYDDSEDSEGEGLAHIALLSLVQDTLEYIKSNRGAYSDELNALKDKLQNYYISCFE